MKVTFWSYFIMGTHCAFLLVMGTWENLGDLGNGLFRQKTWEKPGNWAYGLGIAWEMSIFKNMGGFGFHKINFKKSPAAGCFLIYTYY